MHRSDYNSTQYLDRFENNYSSSTSRISEKICSNNGNIQEKVKTR
jgi:hypothetical protein